MCAAPAYTYNFFTGVPAPAGAGRRAVPAVHRAGGEVDRLGRLLSVAQFPAVLRAYAGRHGVPAGLHPAGVEFQELQGAAEYVLPLLLGTATFAAVLVADPWAALAAAGLIYLGMLPLSVRSYRLLQREAEALREAEPP